MEEIGTDLENAIISDDIGKEDVETQSLEEQLKVSTINNEDRPTLTKLSRL